MIRINLPDKGPGFLPSRAQLLMHFLHYNRHVIHQTIQFYGGLISIPRKAFIPCRMLLP